MPDKLLKDGLRTSAKIGGVPEFAELLFVRLLITTCHHGRCPWNPDWIRTQALSNRPRKRLTEIAAALETLRRAHLVARYTAHDGTAYLLIPNHGQRLKHVVRSPWPAPPEGAPDAEGQTFMAIPGALPIVAPPAPAGIGKRPKAGVCVSGDTHFSSESVSDGGNPKGGRRPGLTADTPENGDGLRASSRDEPRPRSSAARDQRPAEECLAELAPRYPRHDLRACLRDARRYVRKQRGEEAEVTVGWFVAHWMPFAAEKKRETGPIGETAAQAAQRAAESAQWQQQQAAQLKALLEGPEPAKGTLDHAIWLEGRKSA